MTNEPSQTPDAPLSKDYGALAVKAAGIFGVSGLSIDFSISSLSALDSWIAGKWGETGLVAANPNGAPDKEQFIAMNQIGCYVGETARRLMGGAWKENCNKNTYPYSVGVVIEKTGLTIFPFMAAYKRLKHGSGQSLKAWFASISNPPSTTNADINAPRQTGLHQKSVIQHTAAAEPPPPQAAPEASPVDPVPLNDKGAELCRQKRYDEALGFYDKALMLDRFYGVCWSNKANCLYMMGRFDAAFACFNRAVDAAPFNAEAWFSKGMAEAGRGKTSMASVSLQHLLSMAQTSDPTGVAMAKQGSEMLESLIKKGQKRITPQAFKEIAVGYELAAAGRFDAALGRFEASAELAPDLSKAWQFCAMCVDSVGRLYEAIKFYTKALNVEPRNAVYWHNKGYVFEKLNRLEEAVSSYNKATDCDPSYFETWNNKGKALCVLKKYEEAVLCLERALELAPSAEAWFNKALAEDEIGRKAKAKISYEKFLELSRPEHEQQRQIARKRILDLADASNAAAEGGYSPAQAPSIKPADDAQMAALYQKGLDLMDANKLQEALDCFDRYILCDPNSSGAYCNKAMVLGDLGRNDEAIKCYTLALERKPSLTPAWINKGALLNQIGKLEEAAACFDKAAEIAPGDPLVWFNKGKNCSDGGLDAQAIRCYDKAIEINPKDANVWNNKGGCLKRLGKIDAALTCYDTTLSLDPKHAFAWNNKGEALNLLGRYDEAIRCYDRALAIKPFASPWCGKGAAFAGLKRHAEAIDQYKLAIDRYAEYAEAWHGKAVSEDALDLKTEAIESYKSFLSFASAKDDAKDIDAARSRLRELGATDDEIAASGPKKTSQQAKTPPSYGTGKFIGQKYEIYRELGKGGFGVVYQVYSHETKAVYALKTFRDEYMKDDSTRALFLKEAQTLIDMDSHPFLVEDYFVDEVGGRPYIAMEYIAPDDDGLNTLTSYLRKRPPDLSQALRWAIQFCHGMEFVSSQGIRCHRDIKPDNIMINQQKILKISDFGLAGIIDSIAAMSEAGGAVLDGGAGKTMRGASFGTPTHMPPEQFVNAADCDERSDIYSFGVVLYQMITGGAYPFMAAPPKDNSPKESNRFWNDMRALHLSSPMPRINSPLFPLIERCTAKKPAERYQAFAALRAELEPILYRISGDTVTVPAREEMNAAEWLNKGLSLKNLGRLEDAVVCYDKSIELRPRDSTASVAFSNKGNCLHLRGRLEDALTCYAEALRLDPKNEKAWCNKGYVLQQQGKYQEAIACYDKSIEIMPDFAIAWNNKSFTYLSLVDYKKTIECADMALKFNPDEDAAWVNKGLCLHDEGRFRDAVAAFDRTLELNPKHESAWNAKGNALLSLKNYIEALRCLDKAIELEPKYSTPWYYKGFVMMNLKKNAEAAKCLRQFLKMANDRQKTQIEDAEQRLKTLGLGR